MKQFYPSRLFLSFSAALAVFMLLVSLPGKLYAQMPPNLDLAFGNFNNWKCWKGISQTGTAATGAAFGSPAVTAPIGGNAPGPGIPNKSRHAITSGTATDYYGRFPIVATGGGLFSMRIGNDSTGSRADRVQYFIHVPTGTPNLNFQIAFATVLQDGAHLPAGQSTFQVIAYDSATGSVIPGANNLYIAKWAIPGFSPFVHPVTSVVDSMIAWLPWTASTLHLIGMGGHTVTLEVTALDCAYGGHWAYGYFDVTSASEIWEAQLMSYNASGDSAILKAPPGYKYYRWYNQNYSKVFNGPNDTARTIKVPLPAATERYQCILTPYASIGANDTIPTPELNRQPPAGIKASGLSGVQVYPNPVVTDLQITFPAPFEGTVSLFTSGGERVYQCRLVNAVAHQVPVAGFASGIYSLILTDRNGTSMVKTISVKQ